VNVIYKYPVNFHGLTDIKLPTDARMLCVCLDPNNTPCLWASLNLDMPHITRTVQLVFTGDNVITNARYISTFTSDWVVVHAFEVTAPQPPYITVEDAMELAK
jgi:hypothetical protein